MALFLVIGVEQVQKGWEKSGYTKLKEHLLSVVPFLLLISLLTARIKAPENPCEWNLVKTVAAEITDNTEKVKKSSGEKETRSLQNQIDSRIIVYPIVGGIFFIATYVFISYMLYKRKYKRLDNNGKALILCKRDLKLLSIMGYKVKQGETLLEYGNRISEHLDENILDFISYYERILYSDTKLSDEEIKKIELSSQRLFRQLRMQARRSNKQI